MNVNRRCNFRKQKCGEEKSRENSKIQRLYDTNGAHVEYKTSVTPVTTGATGTISKSFRKYLSNLPVKHETKELQKTAILGTAHILRKVLM
jgi:hypothetical protein